MKPTDDRIARTAEQLRREFDASFAAPVALETTRFEDVLAIRVGSDPYALRLSEVAAVHVDRKFVPVPSPIPDLLGIVGIRGLLAPVYDLAGLLGYAPATRPRWFVLVQAPQPVGLAFDIHEAHLRLPQAAFADAQSDGQSGDHRSSALKEHLHGTVRADGVLRPLIHVATVLKTIGRRTRAQAPSSGEINNG